MGKKIHPTYEALAGLMYETKDENGGSVFLYHEDKLAKMLEHREEPDENVRKFTVPGLNGDPDIGVCLFEREGMPDNSPLLIVFHGGGFCGGTVWYDYNRISYYTKNVPARVLSVDYRLAPAGRFPNALLDGYTVLVWVCENAGLLNIDVDRIAVGGYSAGATLAAALSLYVRDKGGPRISAQLLMNPVLRSLPDTASAQQFYENNWMLNGKDLAGHIECYLGDQSGAMINYLAFPGFCQNLASLPPAVIAVGEYDPLRDECVQYAMRLMAFGVPTELYVMPRVPHSFDLHTEGCMTNWLWEAFGRALKREFNMI